MFIGIFGISNKSKEILEIPNITCDSCGYTRGILSIDFTYFHFFFIPLFKWNYNYYLKLRCGCIYKLDEQSFIDLKNDQTPDFSKYQKIKENHSTYRYCKNCNKRFDDSYVYCPFCGNRLD